MTETLYELSGRQARIASQIETVAADLLDPDADAAAIHAELEELITAEADNRIELNAKADAWCWVISNLQARAEAREAKARQLQELAKADEIRADVLMGRLVAALGKIDPDSTKWDFNVNGLRSRKSTRVEIHDEIEPENLPEEYQKSVTEISFNKEVMSQQLKAGKTIKGVQLVERRNWRIA
jgi:hypothetical protein